MKQSLALFDSVLYATVVPPVLHSTNVSSSRPPPLLLAALLAVYPIARYGYTRDYDVEQLYRDNRLNMIHEGTAGVQSLDLLGRKMVAKQV